MTFSPRHWATSIAVAIAAFSGLLAPVRASAPTAPETTTPSAAGSGSPSTTAPVDSADTVGEPAVVQSWALSPATDDPNAGTRPNLTYSVAPGDIVKDEVTVYNFGNVPLNLNVYGVDAFNNIDGKFDIKPAAEEPVGVGAWVELDQNLVTVLPGKQITIPITITIPADATPGDHAGAVVAGSTELGQAEGGQAVALERRTGTRVYIRVAGSITEDVRVTKVTAEYQHRLLEPFVGGAATVGLRLENRGNTRVSGTVTLEVTGPFGIGRQRLVLDKLDDVLPGQKLDLETDVPGVRALLFGTATARFEPDAATLESDLAASTGEASFFAPPIGLLLVVLIALLVVLLLRRRAAARRAALPEGTART